MRNKGVSQRLAKLVLLTRRAGPALNLAYPVKDAHWAVGIIPYAKLVK